VVGIAVSDVGLVTNGDLGLDLLTNVVVAADLLVLYRDVGVELIELGNVLIQHSAQRLAHGVVEGNGNRGFGVKLEGRQLACNLPAGAGGDGEQRDGHHQQSQHKGYNSSLHD